LVTVHVSVVESPSAIVGGDTVKAICGRGGAEVVESISSIPQRVLVREVGQALKEAVLQGLRAELTQLRDEFEGGDDAVRNEMLDR
jgi:hypothetical protein